jgi:SAM-dependent methyltransferase
VRFLRGKTPGSLRFRCNICGTLCQELIRNLEREAPSCTRCASTVRYRSLIHLLSVGLFGESLLLRDFPRRMDLVGVGMSDWESYAKILRKKMDYTNTFYDQEPRLDICDIPREEEGRYDFILSSDVFEHVHPPVTKAFHNLYTLLKADGIVVFSVPYLHGPNLRTLEHFPDLYRYEILEEEGKRVLRNRTREGQVQIFRDLSFHGGPDLPLEMRVFSESDLRDHLLRAGFSSVHAGTEPVFQYGIFWKDRHSVPLLVTKGPSSPFAEGFGGEGSRGGSCGCL